MEVGGRHGGGVVGGGTRLKLTEDIFFALLEGGHFDDVIFRVAGGLTRPQTSEAQSSNGMGRRTVLKKGGGKRGIKGRGSQQEVLVGGRGGLSSSRGVLRQPCSNAKKIVEEDDCFRVA